MTGIYYSMTRKWLLSVSRDRYFQFHCTDSGRRLGGNLCKAWCTAVEYDEEAKYESRYQKYFIIFYKIMNIVSRLYRTKGILSSIFFRKLVL